MARFTDFLAGCVVGGVLLSTGVLLAKRGGAGEEIHVSMLKDDTTAVVWAVDRASGKARFVGWSTVPVEASTEMVNEGWRRIGAMLGASGQDELTSAVQSADRARMAERRRAER